MAKSSVVFVCSECGNETGKWFGKCPACGQWNTLTEMAAASSFSGASKSASSAVMSVTPKKLEDIDLSEELRYDTGLTELNRVLGGGIVKGSLVLLGGDPGIGKSTLLLQICQYLGNQLKILYVSGEESARQLRLRAQRLGVTSESLFVLSETDCEAVANCIRRDTPDLVIIDSIQTMNLKGITSSPGSIVQIRECTNVLMYVAKSLEIPIFLVGHVNKDGNIAGPKVLEHIVDAVLYFEGDRNLSYRILRAAKNRFGSTNEIGVFEMGQDGLRQVENPSMMLLSGRPINVPGTCVACVIEGTRPILSEVQALAAASYYNNPLRMSAGFDNRRVSMLLAVLEKRAGYHFSKVDAYVNVVGGLKLDEPAADLPVALALISSLSDINVDGGTAAFGEIGLAGEIRAVTGAQQRVREAARLGLTRCILPAHNAKSCYAEAKEAGIELIGVRTVREAAEAL